MRNGLFISYKEDRITSSENYHKTEGSVSRIFYEDYIRKEQEELQSLFGSARPAYLDAVKPPTVETIKYFNNKVVGECPQLDDITVSFLTIQALSEITNKGNYLSGIWMMDKEDNYDYTTLITNKKDAKGDFFGVVYNKTNKDENVNFYKNILIELFAREQVINDFLGEDLGKLLLYNVKQDEHSFVDKPMTISTFRLMTA